MNRATITVGTSVLGPRKRKYWIVGAAIALLLLLLGGVILSIWSKPTAEVEFVPVERIFKDPNALARFRIKMTSFFRRGSMNAMVEVIGSERIGSVASVSTLIEKSPAALGDGMAIWILNNDEVNAFSEAHGGFRKEEIIGKPRMITDEARMGAFSFERSTVIGGTNYTAGLEVRILAGRGDDKTDLLLGYRDMDFFDAPGGGITNAVIQTNVRFALRVQLPPQERALIAVDREKGKPPLLIFVQAGIQ